MIKIQRILFYLIFVILTILVFIAIYLSSILSRTKSEVKNIRPAILQIQQLVPSLDKKYRNSRRHENDLVLNKFIYNLKTLTKKHANESFLWKVAKSWVVSSEAQLYDMQHPDVGNVVNALKTAKILKADIDLRGTQLKLLLTLEGDQKAIFKPKWYPIEKVIGGPVYAGKDRYGSEIVAFYLSAILKKPLAPLATDRSISLKREILPVATDQLKATIFKNNNDGKFCVYGKCFYCSREDPVCEDENESLTGAIILNVDANFKHNRSPWQRTYKNGKVAAWEVRDDYCDRIKPKLSRHRMLDLMDVSIFDFLLQNGDRHHYETLHDNIVFLDNGKGLGNPNVHHVDILAPVYQCCMLRNSTRKRLEQLSGGFLREKLESMPNIFNFITKQHLNALEERLVIIYATINYCAIIK